MPSAMQHIPDATTIAASVVVFFAAVGAAVAGALKAVKEIKSEWSDAFKPKTVSDDRSVHTTVVGATLQDVFSTPMFTEQLRRMTDAIEDNTDAVKALTNLVGNDLHEKRELRHAIDRLMDRLNSQR